MKWFTIFQDVPKGQGDYGGTSKVLFDRKATQQDAEQTARTYASTQHAKISLFEGKRLGRLVATWEAQ